MDATYTLDPRMVGTGLLIGRLVLGLICVALAIGAVGGFANLLVRRKPLPSGDA